MGLNTIYTVCAIAGGTVLALRFLLMLFGLDHGDAGVDLDAGMDLDHGDLSDVGHDGGGIFTFLSVQSISGFFTMFGLVGLGLLQINASDVLSLVGALSAGVFTAWCTGMIFLAMRRLQSEGTLVISNAIGQTGTVYLTIPETGTGSVNVAVQGSLRTLDAVSEKGKRIPTGSIIKVVGITAGKILVVTDQLSESNQSR
jgi:hypothetical protein